MDQKQQRRISKLEQELNQLKATITVTDKEQQELQKQIEERTSHLNKIKQQKQKAEDQNRKLQQLHENIISEREQLEIMRSGARSDLRETRRSAYEGAVSSGMSPTMATRQVSANPQVAEAQNTYDSAKMNVRRVNRQARDVVGQMGGNMSEIRVAERSMGSLSAQVEPMRREYSRNQRQLDRKSSLEADLADKKENVRLSAIDAARAVSPGSLRRDYDREKKLDPVAAASEAARSLGKKATDSEQAQYGQLAGQLAEFAQAIREAKESLANLDSASEDYTETQKQLNETVERSEKGAKENLQRQESIRQTVADRQPQEDKYGKLRDAGERFAGFAQNVGSLAERRYTNEEELKNYGARQANRRYSDLRSAASSGEALVATQGVELGLSKDNSSSMTGSRDAIAADVKAKKQYTAGLVALGQGLDLGVKTASGVAESAGNLNLNPLDGFGLGKAGAGVAKTALNVVPEAVGRLGRNEFGLARIGEGVEALQGSEIPEKAGVMGRAARTPGKMLVDAGRTITSGYDISQAQTREQISGMERERNVINSMMAQSTLDSGQVAGQFTRTGRGDQAERLRRESLFNKTFMGDQAQSMGLSREDTASYMTGAANVFGNRGNQAASGGMMAASADRAGFEDSLGSMASLKNANSRDSQRDFAQLIGVAMSSGLDQSREFKMLTQAAVQTAESTGSFEGSFKNLTEFLGPNSGPNQVRGAMSLMDEQSSLTKGFGGKMEDAVKLDRIQGVMKDSGMGDEDVTMASMALQSMDADQLGDDASLRANLTSKQYAALEKSGGLKNLSRVAKRSGESLLEASGSDNFKKLQDLQFGSGDEQKSARDFFSKDKDAYEKAVQEGNAMRGVTGRNRSDYSTEALRSRSDNALSGRASATSGAAGRGRRAIAGGAMGEDSTLAETQGSFNSRVQREEQRRVNTKSVTKGLRDAEGRISGELDSLNELSNTKTGGPTNQIAGAGDLAKAGLDAAKDFFDTVKKALSNFSADTVNINAGSVRGPAAATPIPRPLPAPGGRLK